MKPEETVVWGYLQQQSKAGRKRSALITDIDNTLYRAGHEGAVQAAWELRKNASDAPYPIIAVTGADYQTMVHLRLESGELPKLEVVVGKVGTEIWFLLPDGSYKKDEEYEKQLQATGYKRVDIAKKVSALLPNMRQKGFTIDFQDPATEAAYQKNPDPISYKTSLHFFADDKKSVEIGKVFAQEFPESKIVVCEEIHHNATLAPNDHRKKYCLDIMAATKSDAANYLIKKLQLEQGVVAGDSGNDVDMLLETPKSFVAVAVGGHKAELKTAFDAYQKNNNRPKTVFVDTNDNRLAAQTLLLFHDYLAGNKLSLDM